MRLTEYQSQDPSNWVRYKIASNGEISEINYSTLALSMGFYKAALSSLLPNGYPQVDACRFPADQCSALSMLRTVRTSRVSTIPNS